MINAKSNQVLTAKEIIYWDDWSLVFQTFFLVLTSCSNGGRQAAVYTSTNMGSSWVQYLWRVIRIKVRWVVFNQSKKLSRHVTLAIKYFLWMFASWFKDHLNKGSYQMLVYVLLYCSISCSASLMILKLCVTSESPNPFMNLICPCKTSGSS